MADTITTHDAVTKRADYTRVALAILTAVLTLTAISRLAGVFTSNWTNYGGELFINFPGLIALDWLNPALHASVISASGSNQWFYGPGWFYGPFHHIAYVPLLAWAPSVTVFFQILLVAFVVGIVAALAAVAREERRLSHRHRRVFLLLMVALTFNQFSVLDNLRQRNSELLEFILLLTALWAFNRRREAAGGSLLALAGLTKLLPVVFFIALPVKRLSRAVIAYLAAALVVIVLAEGMLGWENYALFHTSVAAQHGLPTADAIYGRQPITQPSDFRSSLYTFLLLPYYQVTFASDDPRPTVQRTGSSLMVPHIAFALIILVVGVSTVVALARTGTDWLFAFGLLGTLMLMASPHANPHYYVFPLFGFFWFVRRFLERLDAGRTTANEAWLAALLGLLLLMFGSVVPFGLVDRIFGFPSLTYFSMVAVYGIQGLATFLLWCLLMFTKFGLDGSGRTAAFGPTPATSLAR